ncbi:AAA family ATPase [Pseudomonas viridiflava]|uniref:AAA family ATPase n=1 Tax=Pseudomonas viridiflava TaxID=33069 RepID=UPI000F033ED1|nr:ATP-binding protein [Pseudomonas viridiflava]
MSKAGIQSNRGDGYQTLVAFEWALSVLSDPDYQWLEVDSVSCSVDDLVIGKVNGIKIYCQCKKNQALHKSWSTADLADELRKAISLLANDPTAEIRFYSRSAFGDLSRLREYSTNYADETTYQSNLGKALLESDTELGSLLVEQASNLSTYQFLRRTTFEISPELDRMEAFLRERLCRLVSNGAAAYNTLWTRLDYLGMRIIGHGESSATQHRLSKDNLKVLLDDAGSMLTPPIDMVKVRTAFKSTSAIGRSWRRDIGSESLSNPSVNELIEAIEAKHGSILLTGLPGSGKTCVMLAVQEALEQRAQTRVDLLPLFIQSREFADIVTAQDRQALGLPEHWVEGAARMAEDAHVVVIIDSLDVLSIAREHSVLAYFLAQIDRLLLVPNITVVTACRDFDCHYDRRIAQRSWGTKITCRPLQWDTEIAPLLVKLGIEASAIDTTTRELICNPRELALFVELAQQGGIFNVVTSQALAQRYLATTVQANSALGDAAMQAIEAIATEMLTLRSLAVPRQRFTASQDIQRALLSNNVLHETQDGQLTFGHQTLLDVLVISGAVRQAVTLNAFIQRLPPVPFVRPSIRSFVTQLTTGDRREFRKQLRTVLTGNNAFHIRRLVAETFTEQPPHDDDWLLILDLRNQHRDVFQVIYTQAARVEWHHFWMRHLVPFLKDTRDVDGLTMHVHRVSQWKNDDAVGVFAFWSEVLTLDGVDNAQLTNSIAHAVTQVHADHSAVLVPLLVELLKLPRQEHTFLGHALARCVKDGGMDDTVLWRYVAGEVTDEDVLAHSFDKKLHCQPHEFGTSNNSFLADRMRKSTALLDLAIASIERWSQVKNSRYGEAPKSLWSGFLHQTSYNDAHTQTEHWHLDSERILLDAVETAIVHHASAQSSWWKSNSERLCFSTEGALSYFAILACMAAPATNLDVIGRMLCNKKLLDSALSYELGTLIHITFLHLDAATQDAIHSTVLTLHRETTSDPKHHAWILRDQAQLILTIPCHLRSADAQGVLDECEKEIWPLIRQPDIHMRGGMVSAPFSFEVFLGASDDSVLGLLDHYKAYARSSFDDFLMGGEREVGSQLCEAASRHPTRFMELLSANWERIPDRFRDYLMEGIATYLAYRYGNLQVNGTWLPEDEPSATALAQHILNELETHPSHWHHNRVASKAIESCAHVVELPQDATRLVSLAADFSTLLEESSISGDSVDLVTAGINMVKGRAAEALMILANQLEKNGVPWPQFLPNALRLFAADPHPAIRALLLRRMSYLQSHHPELGWELFGLTMQEKCPGLWPIAESSLYYAYFQKFEIVALWLARIYHDGSNKDFETWGRISALAALSKRLDFSSLLVKISAGETVEAWCGAASVWTHSDNIQQHREQCLAGLKAGLNAENHYAVAVARKFCNLFQGTAPLVAVPIKLIRRCLFLLATEADSARNDIYGFNAWLNAMSLRDPMYALEATEIYLDFVRQATPYLYDHESNFTQLLTRLFAQAEEQEELDGGAMLQRVIATQDLLLTLGVDGINDWLKAAERR